MTPPDRRRIPRPASSPTRVEVEDGKVTVEGDAVTPREMHAHLSSVYDKIDTVDHDASKGLADVRVDFEKRLGRVEKLVIGLVIVTASPKLGGPALPQVTKAALQLVRNVVA